MAGMVDNLAGRRRSSSAERFVRARARGAAGGFTLLEVAIALAILTVSLMILVSAQSSSANMTVQSDRILIGTMLARQKLAELECWLDTQPGFSEQDIIEEEGDFEGNFPGQFAEYRWKIQIRKLDLSGTSTGGLTDLLGLSSGEETEAEKAPGAPEQPDLANLINMDEISEQLARYIREVKVMVYWQDGMQGDEVVLASHVIKPTGQILADPDAAAASGTGQSGNPFADLGALTGGGAGGGGASIPGAAAGLGQ